MSEFKFPTEEVDIPSKGLIYPKENPLSSGKVVMKYMTAKEEDILSNQAYIKKGIVLDKLLQSLIIDKDIKIDDLIIGDKNALLIASRILGYGKDYKFEIDGVEETVDLTTLEDTPFDPKTMIEGKNEFSFTVPSSSRIITYKILTGRDEKAIEREIQGLKKLNKESSTETSTRWKHIIQSVDGDTEKKQIREFVDNQFLARDSRSFREHIKLTQPDINLTTVLDSGKEVTIPIGLRFFWPDI